MLLITKRTLHLSFNQTQHLHPQTEYVAQCLTLEEEAPLESVHLLQVAEQRVNLMDFGECLSQPSHFVHKMQ